MPSLKHRLPVYQCYSKIYARVKINCRTIHLGAYDSPESIAEYNRLVAEWLASGRTAVCAQPLRERVTVQAIAVLFAHHAQGIYRNAEGDPTGTAKNYAPTLAALVDMYGPTPAEEFGPLRLIAFRDAAIARGLARQTVNEWTSRVKKVFRFAASRELIDANVSVRLGELENLRKFESKARESRYIPPVDDAIVDRTLPFLPGTVSAMVRLQRLTGARPGEIVQIRPCDIDRSKEVWEYTPRRHKTEHQGKLRVIAIGPRAQRVLSPYLFRDARAECFSPLEAWESRKWSEGRRRKPKVRYSVTAYRRAIVRGCEKAFGMPKHLRRKPRKESLDQKKSRESAARAWRKEFAWHPNQLRHTAATAIKQTHGDESARVTLGHTSVKTTAIYAERDLKLARQVAIDVG